MSVEAKKMRRLEPAAIAGVMSRELANFRTYWKGTTFSSILEPIVYLLAFGLGLSATLVNEVNGVPYIQFVGTGMVAVTPYPLEIPEVWVPWEPSYACPIESVPTGSIGLASSDRLPSVLSPVKSYPPITF